jgi:large subunit ribosomal protein L13
MRSTTIVKASDVTRTWFVVDAEGHTLGRLSSEIARVLRGKHKPIYSTFIDTGDYVIVVNAEKIKVTGKKLDQKLYRRHSGWTGGMKETPLRQMMAKKPEEVIVHAVKGMLPKNTLGDHMLKKLRVYKGPEHDHAAQKPEPLVITY